MFRKLYEQLGHIDECLHRQQDGLHDTSEQAKRINEQLAAINRSINNRRGFLLPPFLQIANFCVSLALVCFFAYYTLHTAHAPAASGNSAARGMADGANRPSLPNQQVVQAEAHLRKLDSLIIMQTQSLKELKNMNRIALRTFQHIRKHLDSSAARAPLAANGAATQTGAVVYTP